MLVLNRQWQGFGASDSVATGCEALLRRVGARPDVVVPVQRFQPLTEQQGVLGLDDLVDQIHWLINRLQLDEPERVFQLAGDCGAEMAPISWLSARAARDLTVVWVDAHGDLNTPQTSPSGTFHGMVLRTLLGDGPDELVRLLTCPLRPDQLRFVGVRSLDAAEADYMQRHDLQVHRLGDLAVSGRVYVHIDLDSLDPAEFGHVPVPEPDGLSVREVADLLHRLHEDDTVDLVGVGLAESTASLDHEIDSIDPILVEFARSARQT